MPAATAQKSGDHDDPCAGTVTDKQRDAAAKMIRLSGYDCKTVNAMCPYVFSEGFTVYCNGMRYKFEIENHGGKWSVKAP